MRKFPPALPLLLFAFLTACMTLAPRTADLRIGMSKDEAIKVMGQPSTTSAQANFQYLNYTMAEATGITSTVYRPYYVRLVDGKVESFGYAGQFGSPSAMALSPRPASVSNPTPATADGLKIVSIEPASVTPGQPTTITVTLRYSLQSQAQATIGVGFNTTAKSAMAVRENRTVQNGAGEITVSTMVTPVDWGDLADFKVTAILANYPPTGARSLAADVKPIALKK